MRELTEHRISKLNRECITVHAVDEKNEDGANHDYAINVIDSTLQKTVAAVRIKFQNGGLKEVGPNGITDQALIAIVLDRMRGFNEGPYSCNENRDIIEHLSQALGIMEARAAERAHRGVEGERVA